MEQLTHHEDCVYDECTYELLRLQYLQMTVACGQAAMEYVHHHQEYCIKNPVRTSILTGHQWVWELWHDHDRRFFQNMLMRKPMLCTLIVALVNIDGLPAAPKNVTLEESMAIFLLVLGQGATYLVIEERLQRSSETVSNYFHMVLKAVARLGKRLISPADKTFSNELTQLVENSNAWPYFKGCISAIDGTHITIHIPDGRKVPWINRKGVTTTNVLATCDFNMCITYTVVGMEGSMHDSRVLNEALRQKKLPFPVPPANKYYLADAGYPLMSGFLTPYRSTRYHLPEFRQNRTFRTKSELFNYRHFSLRSVIERTFGVLKKRWRVLHNMPIMNLKTQTRIIWACIALHNFIRMYDAGDIEYLGDIEEIDDDLSSRLMDNNNAEWIIPTQEETKRMERFRNNIRDMLPNVV